LLWTLMAYVEEFKPEETEGKELVQQRVEGMLASLPAVQTNKVFFRFLQIHSTHSATHVVTLLNAVCLFHR